VPWGGVFHGSEEAKAFWGKVNTYLEDHVAIESVVDGGDRIAVIGRGSRHDQRHRPRLRCANHAPLGIPGRTGCPTGIVLDVPTMQAALEPWHEVRSEVPAFLP
jgi:hypothetical protein